MFQMTWLDLQRLRRLENRPHRVAGYLELGGVEAPKHPSFRCLACLFLCARGWRHVDWRLGARRCLLFPCPSAAPRPPLRSSGLFEIACCVVLWWLIVAPFHCNTDGGRRDAQILHGSSRTQRIASTHKHGGGGVDLAFRVELGLVQECNMTWDSR